MQIIVGCDHGGFALKQQLIPYIEQLGYSVHDIGCFSTESVDYPDIAFPLASEVAAGKYSHGIIICGTGIGVSICCNRFPEVRCALCGDVVSASLTRRHNDSNILAMGGRIIGVETAKAIVETWLSTEYEGGRHQSRLDKIASYTEKL